MDGEQRLGIGDYIAQELMKKLTLNVGNFIRICTGGAPPTASDRILASDYVYAVDLLNQKFDRMVAWKDRKVVDAYRRGISTYKNVERKDSLVETALSLDIYIGDDI